MVTSVNDIAYLKFAKGIDFKRFHKKNIFNSKW